MAVAPQDDALATLLWQYVEEIARYRISAGGVEPQVIISADQFLLVQAGWQGIRRVHGITLHAREARATLRLEPEA